MKITSGTSYIHTPIDWSSLETKYFGICLFTPNIIITKFKIFISAWNSFEIPYGQELYGLKIFIFGFGISIVYSPLSLKKWREKYEGKEKR